MYSYHGFVSWSRIIESYHGFVPWVCIVDSYHGFAPWIRIMDYLFEKYPGFVSWVCFMDSYHGFASSGFVSLVRSKIRIRIRIVEALRPVPPIRGCNADIFTVDLRDWILYAEYDWSGF